MATTKHVLILPYPAFGHINPLLDLARKISQFHRVTFAVSEIKLVLLRRHGALNPQIESQINFIGLQDGFTEENEKLQSGFGQFVTIAEKTAEVTRDLCETMSAAGCKGRSHYGPVDVTIVDIASAESTLVLIEKKYPYILYNAAGDSPLVKYIDINENTATAPDEAFFLPPDPKTGVAVPEATRKISRHFKQIWTQARSVVVNTVEKLEQTAILALKGHPYVSGKEVRSVGLLFPRSGEDPLQDRNQHSEITDWLNGQPEHSVVYFSFGSLAVSSPAQVKETAKALLLLNKPFIRSLKSHEQQSLPAELLDKLSSQFNQTSKFLVLSWAPQKMILEHQATKVFVSHCGWNSTLETLIRGIPVVGWPMFSDQFDNAALLEQLGTGITVPGTCMMVTRIVSAEEILQAIQTTAGWDENDAESKFWLQAQEVGRSLARAVAPGGSAYNALLELVHCDIPA